MARIFIHGDDTLQVQPDHPIHLEDIGKIVALGDVFHRFRRSSFQIWELMQRHRRNHSDPTQSYEQSQAFMAQLQNEALTILGYDTTHVPPITHQDIDKLPKPKNVRLTPAHIHYLFGLSQKE